MPAEERDAAGAPEEGPRDGLDPAPAAGGRGGSPTPSGEPEDPRSRPDIRAARTETRLRRWALLLLVLIPVGYFLYQYFS